MAEIAYKPIGKVNPSDADITPTFQTPPYDDVGVSYKGYSKTKVSGNQWQLNRQDTRFVSMRLASGAFGSTLFLRPLWETKTFYCTGILINSENSLGVYPTQIHVADVSATGSASIKYYHFVFATNDRIVFIDLRDCPRKFSGKNFDLYTQTSFGASDHLNIQLFGWEE